MDASKDTSVSAVEREVTPEESLTSNTPDAATPTSTKTSSSDDKKTVRVSSCPTKKLEKHAKSKLSSTKTKAKAKAKSKTKSKPKGSKHASNDEGSESESDSDSDSDSNLDSGSGSDSGSDSSSSSSSDSSSSSSDSDSSSDSSSSDSSSSDSDDDRRSKHKKSIKKKGKKKALSSRRSRHRRSAKSKKYYSSSDSSSDSSDSSDSDSDSDSEASSNEQSNDSNQDAAPSPEPVDPNATVGAVGAAQMQIQLQLQSLQLQQIQQLQQLMRGYTGTEQPPPPMPLPNIPLPNIPQPLVDPPPPFRGRDESRSGSRRRHSHDENASPSRSPSAHHRRHDRRRSRRGGKNAPRLDYKRVDEVWDNEIHNYRLQDTTESTDSEYEDYLFHVRRTFDWEGKYRNTYVDIRSGLLRDALQDVIGDVSGVSLVDTVPKVDPNLLFLYLDDFRAYMKRLKKGKLPPPRVKPGVQPKKHNKRDKKKQKKKLKKQAEKKRKYLKVLTKYIDEDYKDVKSSLYPMLANGLITFDYLWALWKPDTLAFTTTYGCKDEPRAFKVEFAEKHWSIMRGDFYLVGGKYLEFDGKTFGYGSIAEEIDTFQGARKITSLPCYPLKYHKNEKQVRKQLIERGKKFVSLAGVHYKAHKGLGFFKRKRAAVKVNVNGRVMVDAAIHRRINPNYSVSHLQPDDPDVVSDEEECGCDDSDDEDNGSDGMHGLSDDDMADGEDSNEEEEEVEFVKKLVRTEKGKVVMVMVPKDEAANERLGTLTDIQDGGEKKSKSKKGKKKGKKSKDLAKEKKKKKEKKGRNKKKSKKEKEKEKKSKKTDKKAAGDDGLDEDGENEKAAVKETEEAKESTNSAEDEKKSAEAEKKTDSAVEEKEVVPSAEASTVTTPMATPKSKDNDPKTSDEKPAKIKETTTSNKEESADKDKNKDTEKEKTKVRPQDKNSKENSKIEIPDLTNEQYLIASPLVLGFSFSEKLWLELTVSGIAEIQWNEDAYDSLVLAPKTKQIVKALVESHKYHAAESIDDVIQGKGKGLVAVLHGPPGTGKTLTAEGISEFLKCPLYMASAGELGTDSRFLEQELQKILDICHAWGAILLLDEADVFLEQRNLHDLHRNAMVSIFLRQLEYFQGILFLTTNRVETFDEAFQSRIHIALRYDTLEPKARKAIFKMFVERVRVLEKVDLMPFTEDDYTMLSRRNLNGRQIKNTVRTAQALAVNKGEPLSMTHVLEVLDVMATFDRDLKGGTGYDEAMRSYT